MAKQHVIACWTSGRGRCRGVRLAGLGLALGPDDELDPGQGQQVAQLGRVQEVRGGQGPLGSRSCDRGRPRARTRSPCDLGPDGSCSSRTSSLPADA